MLLNGDVGEVDERVVQLVDVTGVLGRAEAGEAVHVQIHAERPATTNRLSIVYTSKKETSAVMTS